MFSGYLDPDMARAAPTRQQAQMQAPRGVFHGSPHIPSPGSELRIPQLHREC